MTTEELDALRRDNAELLALLHDLQQDKGGLLASARQQGREEGVEAAYRDLLTPVVGGMNTPSMTLKRMPPLAEPPTLKEMRELTGPRYVVFIYDDYYPGGGLHDYRYTCDTLENAKKVCAQYPGENHEVAEFSGGRMTKRWLGVVKHVTPYTGVADKRERQWFLCDDAFYPPPEYFGRDADGNIV
jgi:hypothetical protein